jgi:hypothetical protein
MWFVLWDFVNVHEWLGYSGEEVVAESEAVNWQLLLVETELLLGNSLEQRDLLVPEHQKQLPV